SLDGIDRGPQVFDLMAQLLVPGDAILGLKLLPFAPQTVELLPRCGALFIQTVPFLLRLFRACQKVGILKGRLKQRLAVRQFLNLVPGNVEEALDLIALALGLATILAQALEGQVSVRGGTHFLLALRDAVRRSGEGADDLPALFALARVFDGAFQ